MTTKERARLIGLAMNIQPIFQIGKQSMNPGLTEAVSEALEARELIKISVLNNCADDPRELAKIISERTGSDIVQVIGKKIVLYKKKKEEAKKPREKAVKKPDRKTGRTTGKKAEVSAKRFSKETTRERRK